MNHSTLDIPDVGVLQHDEAGAGLVHFFLPELSLVTTTAAAVACFLNKRFKAYTTIKKSIVDFCLDGARAKKTLRNQKNVFAPSVEKSFAPKKA